MRQDLPQNQPDKKLEQDWRGVKFPLEGPALQRLYAEGRAWLKGAPPPGGPGQPASRTGAPGPRGCP